MEGCEEEKNQKGSINETKHVMLLPHLPSHCYLFSLPPKALMSDFSVKLKEKGGLVIFGRMMQHSADEVALR